MDTEQTSFAQPPVIDGSKDFDKVEPGNEEAYRKLLEESEKINSILYDSEIVEDGQGRKDIPEEVAEMGDSIASTLEFDGKVEAPNSEPEQERVQEDYQNDIPIQDMEQQFEQHSNHYDQDARTQWYSQLEAERPYLVERNQQLERELVELRKQKEAFEDEEIKSYESKIIEGIKDAHQLGEIEKHTLLVRELARLDRIKEDRKRERANVGMPTPQHPSMHPQYSTQQSINYPTASQAAYNMPPQQQYYPQVQQPQQYMTYPPQPSYTPVPNYYQAHQQPAAPYQHPFTAQMPTQPSSGPRSATPSSAPRSNVQTAESPNQIHSFARSLLATHKRPPGMSLADYERLYLDINKGVKDK